MIRCGRPAARGNMATVTSPHGWNGTSAWGARERCQRQERVGRRQDKTGGGSEGVGICGTNDAKSTKVDGTPGRDVFLLSRGLRESVIAH